MTRVWLYVAVIVLAALAFEVWAVRYSFTECRRVGHSKTYCVLQAL